MHIEIVSSGEPRRTIIRSVETGEEITNVISADIHLGLDGCYANLLVSHPIIKYVGTTYVDKEYTTIEKKYVDTPESH